MNVPTGKMCQIGFSPVEKKEPISLFIIVSNWMMPAGGVLVAVLAGWGLKKSATLDELQIVEGRLYKSWRFLVRYLVPAVIALVFATNL